MKKGFRRYQTPLALAGAVLVCSVYIYVDRHTATTDELQQRRRNVFQAFHRERVDHIEIQHASGTYELKKSGADWVVVANGRRRPADVIEVERLLSEIEGAEATRTLGTLDTRAKERFGLDQPRARVVIHEGTEVSARFSVGGAVQGEEAVYVEASATTGTGDRATQAVVLPRSFGQPFDRMSVEFRDRKVAELDAQRITRLEIVAGDTRKVLEHRGPVWRVSEPDLGRAARGAVEAITSELHDLRATRVVADDPDADTLRRYGLETPSVRLTVTRAAGVEPVSLRVGGQCPNHEDEYTATREGTGTVVCLARAFVDGLKAPAEGFRDDHVLAARTDEVSEVRVKGAGTGGADLVLRRDGTQWRGENSPYAVDMESIESWLTTLHDLSTPQRLAADQRAAHGFGAPLATVEVSRTGVEGVERIVVGSADATGVYVARDDEAGVMQFPPSVVDTLRVEAIRFRPRRVIHDAEEDLRAVLLDAGAMHEEILRGEGGTYQLTRPVAYAADPGLVGEMVRALTSLDADRWVSSTARPEHGLATPRARLVARFEGPGAHDESAADGGTDAGVARVRTYGLTLGAPAPGGGLYASLDGTAGVFVADRSLLEQVTTPHLDRAALRVDREAVTRLTLTVTSPAPRRVVLERVAENRWRTDTGTPVDEARTDALFNDLAAIASPRVFGYGAPGASVRMVPPVLVIELGMGGDAGNTTQRITVGERFGAGEGAGYYARREGLDATLSLPERLVETLQQFQP
jgi:hypothetical protein